METSVKKSSQPLVLGVDDDLMMRTLARQALEEGGFQVMEALMNWLVLRQRVRYMIRAGDSFEAEIRSEERSRALRNAIPAMVFQIDRNGIVQDFKNHQDRLHCDLV